MAEDQIETKTETKEQTPKVVKAPKVVKPKIPTMVSKIGRAHV